MALKVITKPFHLALLAFVFKNYTLDLSFVFFSLCFVHVRMKEGRIFFFLFNQSFRLIAGYYHCSTHTNLEINELGF